MALKDGERQDASIDALTSSCGLAFFQFTDVFVGLRGGILFYILFSRIVDGRRRRSRCGLLAVMTNLHRSNADEDDARKPSVLAPLIYRRKISLSGKYPVGP